MVRATAIVLVAAALLLPGSFALPSALVPIDDAGSRRDAPPGPGPGAILIEAGRVYDASFGAFDLDAYAFDATVGQTYEAKLFGHAFCADVHAPSGALSRLCQLPPAGLVPGTITESGRWTIVLSTLAGEPGPYRFVVALDGPAPDPAQPIPAVDEPLIDSITDEDDAAPSAPTAARRDGAHVVVAVIDSGINPYHQFFRAPALVDHPATWIPGFPEAAAPLALSLDAPDVSSALARDAATLDAVLESGRASATEAVQAHVYTIPGTRIVAALAFTDASARRLEDPVAGVVLDRPIYDDDGHGTASAGLVGGADLALPDGNVLLVAIEVQSVVDTSDALAWVAAQPWIDAISMSRSTPFNVPSQVFDDPALPALKAAAASGKAIFIASGNGHGNFGTPDQCSSYLNPYLGPIGVTRIGAANSENGNPVVWHCKPVEAIARTNVMSPVHDSLDGFASASGTSASAPNAAGIHAALLLRARREGIDASPALVATHLVNASAPAPAAIGRLTEPTLPLVPLAWRQQGYGLLDAAAAQRALETLRAGAPTPRPEMDPWVALDRGIREALWGP